MRTFILLTCLLLSGCKAVSVSTEYGVSMTPNAHGMMVPTYSTKLILKE